MSLKLTHMEKGWLDEFAKAALPAMITRLPAGSLSALPQACYQVALEMIIQRRHVQLENDK